MESVIFFIIIVAINILSKSVQDKKKIDRNKAKRARELGENLSSNIDNRTQRVSSVKREKRIDNEKREALRRNLEQEYLDKRQKYVEKKQERYDSRKYDYTIQEERFKKANDKDYANRVDRDSRARMGIEDYRLKEIEEETKKESKARFKKKRLVDAIIWSEILGEPKSIQNLKKDM